MFAIRARRKAITEKDLIAAIDKVIKGYKKFSATGKYMVYNWNIMILDIPTINLELPSQFLNWFLFISK